MSIKLVLLKSNEVIITDAKELTKDENVIGYLLKNPHKVSIQREVVLTERVESDVNKREVNIVLASWMPLSGDNEFVISPDWVVCIMNPEKSVLKIYEEKVNG